MDIQDVHKTRKYFESAILELLVELEQKTGVYVHFIDFERLDADPGGVGPIGKVTLTLGLDET